MLATVAHAHGMHLHFQAQLVWISFVSAQTFRSKTLLEIIFKFISWCNSFPEDDFFLIIKSCLQDKTHKQPSCSTRVVHRLYILCSVMRAWASASHVYVHSLHIDHYHCCGCTQHLLSKERQFKLEIFIPKPFLIRHNYI